MKLKKIMPVLRVAISLLLMFLLYRRVDLGEVRTIFTETRLDYVALLFAMLLLNTVISAFKWQLLLRADGIRIPLRSLVSSYLVGSFFNIFLPSNIGGDAYRIYDVAQFSKRTAHSFASVLADRLSGFVALVLLGFLFGLTGYRKLPDPEVLAIPLLAFLALAALIGALLQQGLVRWFFEHTPLGKAGKLKAFAYSLLDSVTQYRQAPGLFARIMGLSFVFQFNAISCIYVLALSLNLAVPFMYFCIFIPFISLIEALPISIYGLGIRDASYAFFFAMAGVPKVQCLTLALAYVIMTLIYSLSGGFIFMLRPKANTRTA